MNKTVDTFIALLRSAITGTNESIDLKDADFEALYALSSFHDLAHVAYYELNKRIEQWQGETYCKFKQKYDMSLYRCIRRDLAIEQVKKTLENAEIPFVLLKGACLMRLYPETWMRTSSDIDVLVEPQNHKKAIAVLEASGFELFTESSHDVSFFSPDKYHVELHHSLVEEGRLPKTAKLLKQVWQYTAPIEERFERTLNDEMFNLYHFAHMAKHLKEGGCGVRYFIDLWLLDHRTHFDPAKRELLIRKSGLLSFADESEKLTEKWFSAENCKENLSVLEEFILRGGIYGSLEQSVVVRKNKVRGRFSYYIVRIFPTYNMIKYSYPVLRFCPLLLPFCWVIRWFKLLSAKTRKRALNEIKVETATDDEDVARVNQLMKQLRIE